MAEQRNRAKVAAAFQGWMDGTSYITSLLADELQWCCGTARVSRWTASPTRIPTPGF